jgi:hypothetical protein
LLWGLWGYSDTVGLEVILGLITTIGRPLVRHPFPETRALLLTKVGSFGVHVFVPPK